MKDFKPNIKGKKILVTGGTGTVGKKLVEKLLANDAEVVRVYSRDEHKQFIMQEDLLGQGQDMDHLRFLLGDVRDKERLKRAMENIDIVFHLAALKHVPACEYNPSEAVKTNVLGTQNVIDCAIEANVEAMVYASTDKAASPTNTMGASKLLAERMVASADQGKGPRRIKFLSVRFGNIMNSRGSVVPLFTKQISRGGPVTVTDACMTRFFMSVDHAVDLILNSMAIAQGGETFVFKMPVLKVGDLAQAIIELSGKQVTIDSIGLRPGEKMYEELMSEEESARGLEMDDMFVILPYDRDRVENQNAYTGARLADCGIYSSMNVPLMGAEDIKKMLKLNCIEYC
ncbi:MAG: SDR family NAD(P)-dependent oxidoreductase [Syntrophomonadaceae bacterium]|nr:SDR family NAD(P)-dependent oxidoreductase [Syntrophomonadaceae bacterium]